MTDQFIHQHIDNQKYDLHSEALKQEASRFNLPKLSDPTDSLLDGAPLSDIPDVSRSKLSSTKVQGADDYSIVSDQDYRLMLLRHWSLYESMYHSSYVAARLGIWKEKGRRRLTNLLVKMGYLLIQSFYN